MVLYDNASLLWHAGIKSVYVNVSDEVVLVETSLPSSAVQQCLEDTGRLVVFRGYGGQGVHCCSFLPLSIYSYSSDLIIDR